MLIADFFTVSFIFPISLQDVPPALLIRFLREHRSEWADSSIDAYSASSIRPGVCGLPEARVGNYGNQIILPLAHTIENEEVHGLLNWLPCQYNFYLLMPRLHSS